MIDGSTSLPPCFRKPRLVEAFLFSMPLRGGRDPHGSHAAHPWALLPQVAVVIRKMDCNVCEMLGRDWRSLDL